MANRSNRRTTHKHQQGGFTLLEVLVAFVIFALVFATTLEILSGSLRNVKRSSEYTQAALWAQSRLDAVGIDPPLESGQYQGEFDDDYSWELEIVPYEFNDGSNFNTEEFPVDLFYVELRVEWGQDPRRLQAVFKTLRSAVPQRDSRT
jgi:general secretion pathway protein I